MQCDARITRPCILGSMAGTLLQGVSNGASLHEQTLSTLALDQSPIYWVVMYMLVQWGRGVHRAGHENCKFMTVTTIPISKCFNVFNFRLVYTSAYSFMRPAGFTPPSSSQEAPLARSKLSLGTGGLFNVSLHHTKTRSSLVKPLRCWSYCARCIQDPYVLEYFVSRRHGISTGFFVISACPLMFCLLSATT